MAAKGEALEDWGCKRRPGVLLLTLAATLVAALAVAQPARADESDPVPAAAAESAASEPAPAAAAPAPAAASASQADGGPAGAPPVTLEAEDPVTLEPAEEAKPEAKPAETPAAEPSTEPAKPAETPASETPAAEPNETTPDEKPADTKPEADPVDDAPAGCTSSGSDSASADASAPATESSSTETSADTSPACAAPDDDEPETCTSSTPAGGSTESTPATSSPPAGSPNAGCKSVTVPVPAPAKPGVPLAPAAPAPVSGTTVMVLVVTQPAAEQPAESTREETPSGAGDADAPERAPVALLASPKSSLPTRQKPIRLEASRAEEEWLGAVRALSPSRTVPPSARRCVRPNGLVPLSRECMTERARAGPLLAMRLKVWPSVPASATEFNEVAREIARARDRRPARHAKRSAPPTLERATPVRRDQRGPWAAGASAGGSAAGTATPRIFALAAAVAVPFTLPRATRVAPRSSLVPTGELGVSLPERPG